VDLAKQSIYRIDHRSPQRRNLILNFGTVLYESKQRVATITLNRPERFNAISETMPEDIAAAFGHANNDDSVHVVVLTGAGRGFCGGYDLKEWAEKPGTNPGIQDMPWDPMIDYNFMSRCTQNFMSIWRCHKPVIARVHGDAVAGGSDIALCCDIIIMNEKARIGYPPSRVWGCPTTAMWVYRLGAEKAKQMLFTGDLISGTKAQEIGLIFQSVPLEELDEAVNQLTNRIKGVPKNQLMMMKMMVNQAYENMGLASTQTFATLFDGMARHSPEGIWFKQRAEEVGFKQAVAERDSGDPIPGSKK
jgi:enoyl-CoA hydratase